MSKIPTAEEYLIAFDVDLRLKIAPYLRQFARRHVISALEAARENSKKLSSTPDTIFNSYDLNNIK